MTGPWAAVLLLVSAAAPWTGPHPGPPGQVPGGDTIRWTLPGAPVGAVGVGIPAGSAADPEGREGATWVLVQSLREELARRLSVPRERVRVSVTPGTVRIVAVVPADQVPAATEVVGDVVLRDPIPRGALEEARVDVLDELRFRRDAPYLAYRLELRRFLLGVTSPWARPVGGTEESVASLDPWEADSLRRRLLDPGRWSLVVVEGRPGRAGVQPGGDLPRVGAAGPSAPTPSGNDPPGAPTPLDARPEADRLVITREITNTWVAAAFPLERDLPPGALDFLRFALEDRIDPAMTDPGLFDSRAEVLYGPGGPILVLEAAVFPQDARRWEARLLDAVEELALNPPRGAFFELLKRRYRSRTALALSVPDEAAFLLLEGIPPGPPAAYHWSREELSEAAGALGRPWILVYGPELGPGGDGEMPHLDGWEGPW